MENKIIMGLIFAIAVTMSQSQNLDVFVPLDSSTKIHFMNSIITIQEKSKSWRHLLKSVDIEEWNDSTIFILKNELHVDTLDAYKDNAPPWPEDITKYDSRIFYADMKYRLSHREKLVDAINAAQILSNEKSLYIEERQVYAAQGFVLSFTVYTSRHLYHFDYNFDTNSFELADKRKDNLLNKKHMKELSKHPVYISEVTDTSFSDLVILTHIAKIKDELFYKTIRVYIN